MLPLFPPQILENGELPCVCKLDRTKQVAPQTAKTFVLLQVHRLEVLVQQLCTGEADCFGVKSEQSTPPGHRRRCLSTILRCSA